MKYKKTALCIAFLFVSCSVVLAQQSDYQIQQDFSAAYNELLRQTDQIDSVEELRQLHDRVDSLETAYSGHSSLLDAALFPETFSGRITDLRTRVVLAQDNIRTIDELTEEVEVLSTELDEFRDRVTRMDEEAASLRQQLNQSSANEEQQAVLLRQYRENLEQRTMFISEFLEELLDRYPTMDQAERDGIENEVERLSDDPFTVVQTLITEYTNLAEQNVNFGAEDYAKMRAQHGYFADVWDRIGQRLAETFAPDNPTQARQEVTDMLATWQGTIDHQFLNALADAFDQQGFPLPEFTTADDFYNAVQAYVDNASEQSADMNNEEDFQAYRNFRDFWNGTVKGEWGDFLTTGKILTASQIAAIDTKVSDWGETAVPTSNLMLILFIISLVVIVGLIVYLIMNRQTDNKVKNNNTKFPSESVT